MTDLPVGRDTREIEAENLAMALQRHHLTALQNFAGFASYCYCGEGFFGDSEMDARRKYGLHLMEQGIHWVNVHAEVRTVPQ